jgi:methionine aminotransferase
MNASLKVASKLPDVGTSIFTVMSELARTEGALNLSQGFPDFDSPEILLDRIQHYLRSGHNQYAPMMGVPSLRAAIAAKTADLYGRVLDPDTEVTVTSGATEALFCAIAAVVQPGDEVIVFDPAYDSYEPVVRLQGGRTRHVPMRPPDYRIDWDRVADLVTDRTRLIITNTPHNPTGSAWDGDDIESLRQIVSGTEIYLLADEVYEHILFDGRVHQSLTMHDDLFARSFVVSSFGKTYHATGWKIGYCCAPAPLTEEFRRIHQFVTFTSNTPIQLGLADFLTAHPEHHLNLSEFYQHKRDLFCRLVADSPFKALPSTGTYFQLLDYSDFSNETDSALAVRLTREAKIASVPVSAFYQTDPGHRVLRFCFAKDDETLARAAEILCGLR